MAHKKAGGSTVLGRDSIAKRLGVKLYAGQVAKPGMIIVRQRGSKFRAGKGVCSGKDDTLYASRIGVVKFIRRKVVKFTGQKKWATIVNIAPATKKS